MRGCQDQFFLSKARQIIETVFFCFVYLEQAFNKVPRQRLLEILVEYGVNGAFLNSAKMLMMVMYIQDVSHHPSIMKSR